MKFVSFAFATLMAFEASASCDGLFTYSNPNAEPAIQLGQCVQNIVDHSCNGIEGVKFAADLINKIDRSGSRSVSENLRACQAYWHDNRRRPVERTIQLDTLNNEFRHVKNTAYFFLRNAIRPLIECRKPTPSSPHYVCTSSTGKRWREFRADMQSAPDVYYRLGHSDASPGLRGAHTNFESTDTQFIRSLLRRSQLSLASLINEVRRSTGQQYNYTRALWREEPAAPREDPLAARTDEFIAHYMNSLIEIR